MNGKVVGNLWNDNSIEIMEKDGQMFALYGWNGEAWCDCWEVADERGIDQIGTATYIVTPVYAEVAEDEFEIIDYEVR